MGDQNTPRRWETFTEIVQRWMCCLGSWAIESVGPFFSNSSYCKCLLCPFDWICDAQNRWASTTHYFPVRWCTTRLGSACSWVPKANIFKLMNWIPWPSSSLFLVGLCQRYRVSNKDTKHHYFRQLRWAEVQFCSIWPRDRTLSGATIPGQSRLGAMAVKGYSVFP